jgi:hypothetical protein
VAVLVATLATEVLVAQVVMARHQQAHQALEAGVVAVPLVEVATQAVMAGV